MSRLHDDEIPGSHEDRRFQVSSLGEESLNLDYGYDPTEVELFAMAVRSSLAPKAA